MKRPGAKKHKAGNVDTQEYRLIPAPGDPVILGVQGPLPVAQYPPRNVSAKLWEADCLVEWNKSPRRPPWMQCAGDTLGQCRCREYEQGIPFKPGWYRDSDIPQAVKKWLMEYASGARIARRWTDGTPIPAEHFDPRRVGDVNAINALLLRTDIYCEDRGERGAGTGAPGRPSKSMDLIKDEHARRVAEHARRVAAQKAGTASQRTTEVPAAVHGVAAQARELLSWLESAHPNYPRPTPGTIENAIRAAHREAGLTGARAANRSNPE